MPSSVALLFVFLLLQVALILRPIQAQTDNCFTAPPLLPNAKTPPEFCPARVFRSNLARPRGIEAVGRDLLVLERDAERVVVLWDADGDGQSSGTSEMAVLASAPGLNHAVVVDNAGYLWAASASAVFRWQYPGEGTHSSAQMGPMETVVTGIPADGHSTRTPAIGPDGLLYVSIGSKDNIDPDAYRAVIKKFDISNSATFPLDWNADGVYYAVGLRNEAGLRFDSHGVLWGVESGSDNFERPDLGTNIHHDMPCEELNRLGDPRLFPAARFFGYPICHSEYALPEGVGLGPGTQWSHSQYYEGTFNDAWCRDPNNVVPPVLCMEAHVTPLDILFWEPNDTSLTLGSKVKIGDAFIAQRGSWNRVPGQGYKLIHVPMQGLGPDRSPTGCWNDVLAYTGSPAADTGPGYSLRPVSVAIMASNESAGRSTIYVSSDHTGEIIVIQLNTSAIGAAWEPCQTAPAFAPNYPESPAPRAARCSVLLLLVGFLACFLAPRWTCS